MSKTIIIAEAGVNHNGSLQSAFELVDVAVAAGVDYVKFQTFKSANLVSKQASKASYQIENTSNAVESQYEMLKKLELSASDHLRIIEYCKSRGINFFSTAFDLDSLKFLASIGLDIVKIPSGELTNLPYLKLAAQLFKKVILSTGMATLEEIGDAMEVFSAAGIAATDITILHCNTEYPTPMEDVNLKAMLQIAAVYGTAVGYSDHTLGIEVPVAAVALGATIIEKHFTLDRTLPGPDHAASLEPLELIAMTSAIRNVELAVSGSGTKEPSRSEIKNIAVARKSIHLSRAKSPGDLLCAEDFEMLRPGDGISPMRMDEIIGRSVKRRLDAGHKLSIDDLY